MATGTPTARTDEQVRLDTWRAWMDEGTRLFDGHVRSLRDHQLLEPSRLPGWTRAHVVAHVARNADALGNLLTWARTGVVTHMYESAEQRERDIEESANESAEVLRFDLDDAERRFAVAVASLPADAWWVEVRTRQGRTVPAAAATWMRCREVWVHAVDLDAGASFADFPERFVHAFLDEVTAGYTARPDCEGIELVATDASHTWSIGPRASDETTVQGPAHALLEWLLGRGDGAGLTSSPSRGLPELPAWM